MGSSVQCAYVEAYLRTPAEQGEGKATAAMEMKLVEDVEVSMDKVIRGLRDKAHNLMLIGHNVFAVVVREMRTTTFEDFSLKETVRWRKNDHG